MCDTKAGFSSPHCSSCWNVILWWGIKKHKWDPRWWSGHADSVLLMVEPLTISGLMGCLESKSVIGFGVALPLACSPSSHMSTCTALGRLRYLCHQRTCGYVGFRLRGWGWKRLLLFWYKDSVKLTFKDLLLRPQNSALLSPQRPSFF